MDKMPALRKSVIVLPTIRNLCLKTWRSDADIALSHSHIHKGFLFNSSDASGDLRGYTEKGKANKWTDKQCFLWQKGLLQSVFVEGHLVDPWEKCSVLRGDQGPRCPGRGAGPAGLRVQFLLRKKSGQSPPLSSALVSCYLIFLGEGDGPDVHV